MESQFHNPPESCRASIISSLIWALHLEMSPLRFCWRTGRMWINNQASRDFGILQPNKWYWPNSLDLPGHPQVGWTPQDVPSNSAHRPSRSASRLPPAQSRPSQAMVHHQSSPRSGRQWWTKPRSGLWEGICPGCPGVKIQKEVEHLWFHQENHLQTLGCPHLYVYVSLPQGNQQNWGIKPTIIWDINGYSADVQVEGLSHSISF